MECPQCGKTLKKTQKKFCSRQCSGAARKNTKVQSTKPKEDFHRQIVDPNKTQGNRHYTRSEPIKVGKNSWTDEGGAEPHAEINKQLYTGVRTPRRPAFKMINIDCERCNKNFEVHPSFIKRREKDEPGDRRYYICDKCIGRGLE